MTVVVSGFRNRERLARGMQPLRDGVSLRAQAEDVVERGAQRALADARHPAQLGDRHRLAEVVAQKLHDAGNEFPARETARRAVRRIDLARRLHGRARGAVSKLYD